MTFRLTRLSKILALILLTVALPAQRGGEGESLSPEEVKAMRSARVRLEKEKAKGDKLEASDSQWEQMTPEEQLRSNVRRGAKNHCRFNVSCRPPQMLPGQSGTLMVVVSMLRNSVMPAPLNLTLVPRVPSNSVAMGALTARPAPLGAMSSAYLGRPVYENTAVLEVPITMGTGLTLGEKLSVSADLQFDIYDGESGGPVGRFIERISTDVLIAAYLDPVVAGSSRELDVSKDVAAVPLPSTEKGVDSAKQALSMNGSGALSGVAARVVDDEANPGAVTEVPSEVPSNDSLLITDSGVGGYWSWMGAGFGFFFAVILILLIRKKK